MSKRKKNDQIHIIGIKPFATELPNWELQRKLGGLTTHLVLKNHWHSDETGMYLPSKDDDSHWTIISGIIECANELLYRIGSEGISSLWPVNRNLKQ